MLKRKEMVYKAAIIFLTAVNIIWTVTNYFMSNRKTLIERKRKIYSDVIASAEEMREAYFENEPKNFSITSKKGWKKYKDGWLHDENWERSPAYMEAASKMNVALADLALVADSELCFACFHLERIAIDFRGLSDRAQAMNGIVTLMREDLGNFNVIGSTIWRKRFNRLSVKFCKIFGLQSNKIQPVDLPWY